MNYQMNKLNNNVPIDSLKNLEVMRSMCSYIAKLSPDYFGKLIAPFSSETERFSLKSDRRIDGIGISREYGDKLYIDGSYAFIVKQTDSPIAVVGFNLDDLAMDIRQLQGVTGERGALRALKRWERMLIVIAEDYGIFAGLKKFMIRPALENGWVQIGKFPEESAKLRYDITAQRCGYKYNERLKRYVKDLIIT